MRAIVTVKLKRNMRHDPRNKIQGNCPILKNKMCTDITGSHHSYIEEGRNRRDIERKVHALYSHITRIEVMEE